MTDLDELLAGIPAEVINDREVEAHVAISTYYGYIKAFTIKIADRNDLKNRQEALEVFKHLQHSKKINLAQLKQPLHRGWLTLKALKVLPVTEYPELATTANFWAPVQAYYSAHGLGMATLIALGVDPPTESPDFQSRNDAPNCKAFNSIPVQHYLQRKLIHGHLRELFSRYCEGSKNK